jgi:hypothetical protein
MAIPLLPPPDFDFPFPGETFVSIIERAHVQPECGGAANVAGCAWTDGETCWIVIAGETLRASLVDILRHEIAHCNGWEH